MAAEVGHPSVRSLVKDSTFRGSLPSRGHFSPAKSWKPSSVLMLFKFGWTLPSLDAICYKLVSILIRTKWWSLLEQLEFGDECGLHNILDIEDKVIFIN